MQRAKLLLVPAAIAAPITFLYSQDTTPAPLEKVPVGVVAGHAMMRYVSNGGFGEAIGYFPFVDGLGNNLFAGARGERTAVLTFRTGQFRAAVALNSRVLFIRPVTDSAAGLAYTIYHDPAPLRRDFSDPATFSTGQAVAVYTGSTAGVVSIEGATVHYAASLELTSSRDFTVGERRVNLASIAPAINVRVTGESLPFDEVLSGNPLNVPLSGSFVAAATKR